MNTIENFKNKILKKYIDNYIKDYVREKPQFNIILFLLLTTITTLALSIGYVGYIALITNYLFMGVLFAIASPFYGWIVFKIIESFIKRDKIKTKILKDLNNYDSLEKNYNQIISNCGAKTITILPDSVFLKDGMPNNELTKEETKEFISLIDKKDYKYIVEILEKNKTFVLSCDDILNLVNKKDYRIKLNEEYNLIHNDEIEMEVNSKTLRRLL